jgi:flagellar FliL protein
MATKTDGAASAESTTTTTRKPGEIATIDSMNVNLEGNHYLRIGVGVQLAAGPVAKDWAAAEGAKVKDVVISVFSGRSMQDLDTTAGREAARDQLKSQLTAEPGPGEPKNDVIDVYLTDFVMR